MFFDENPNLSKTYPQAKSQSPTHSSIPSDSLNPITPTLLPNPFLFSPSITLSPSAPLLRMPLQTTNPRTKIPLPKIVSIPSSQRNKKDSQLYYSPQPAHYTESASYQSSSASTTQHPDISSMPHISSADSGWAVYTHPM